MNVVELFRFVEGEFIETQTSGDVLVSYNDEDYLPYPIRRNSAESKTEMSKASVDITMDLSNPLAQRHLASSIDSVVTLTIFQQTDMGTDTFWKGRLTVVKASNKTITMTFESIFTSLRRPGLRGRWQKSCRHALYARGCNVNPEDHAFEGLIGDIQGVTVTIPGLDAVPSRRYRGGMIRAPDGVVRFIIQHSGNVITLSRPFQQLTDLFALTGPGTVEVKVYPGCQHNMADCTQVFDNLLNYGGFPWIPNKNPIGGSSIV